MGVLAHHGCDVVCCYRRKREKKRVRRDKARFALASNKYVPRRVRKRSCPPLKTDTQKMRVLGISALALTALAAVNAEVRKAAGAEGRHPYKKPHLSARSFARARAPHPATDQPLSRPLSL